MNTEKKLLKLDKFVAPPPATDAGDTVTELVIRFAVVDTIPPQAPPGHQLSAQALLGVVSYCYAKDVCSSREIERGLSENPVVKEVCHGEVPESQVIRRFRRLNRAAILKVLECVFRIRRKQRRTEPLTAKPVLSSELAASVKEACGETTVRYAHGEAEARLEKAAWIDEAESDD